MDYILRSFDIPFPVAFPYSSGHQAL